MVLVVLVLTVFVVVVMILVVIMMVSYKTDQKRARPATKMEGFRVREGTLSFGECMVVVVVAMMVV